MSDELLREIIAGQKEQTELFRRYLWRLRFSLLSLLLLTTATAIGLGVLVYVFRSRPPLAVPPPAIPSGVYQTWQAAPRQQQGNVDDLFGPPPSLPPLPAKK
jgi:hypothetical protein